MSTKQKRNISSSVVVKDELNEMNKSIDNLVDMLGMTLLTNPSYISSSRSIMYTAHLNQAVVLLEPSVARVMFGFENMVGKLSTGNQKAKHRVRVDAIIPKFSSPGMEKHLYTMILYNEDLDAYTVIEKKNLEDLTEKFGYAYVNKYMDAKQEGDYFEEGERIRHTTSYDEYDNYRFGTNARFCYMNITSTIEDAVVVSESLSQRMISKETEIVRVSLNDNYFFVNLYGGKKDYRGFPNVGEYIKDGVLCAKRQIQDNKLLFDVKSSNLRREHSSSDTIYYCSGKIDDIVIYCNKHIDEIEDNSFNAQFKEYYKQQNEYYRAIYLKCKEIIDSGSDYSKDISFLFQKAKSILDTDIKYRDENNNVFNNFVMEFMVERDVPLAVGHKITGRYGNKGVISKILPDDEMPMIENGKHIEIIFNSLGVINRLNSMQLIEQSITFITNRVAERMYEMTNDKERDELLFNILNYFNPKQVEHIKKYFETCSKADYDEFYDDIFEYGITVHIPPMEEDSPIFDRLRQLYRDHEWIKPYDMYVKRFGRMVKIMQPFITGEMYVLKLKQSSKKGMSSRSTGSISRKGMPVKTKKHQNHREPFSKTPIRFGGDENNNIGIGVPSDIIAKLHLLYRSSPIGRQELGRSLATEVDGIPELELTEMMTNRNVEILNAYMKFLGVRIKFLDDQVHVPLHTDDIQMKQFETGKYFLGTDKEFARSEIQEEIKQRDRNNLQEFFIMERDEYDDYMKKEVDKVFKKRYY